MDDLVGQFLTAKIEKHDRALILLRRFKMLLVRRNRLIVRSHEVFREVSYGVRAFRHFSNTLSAARRAALRDGPSHNRIERCLRGGVVI